MSLNPKEILHIICEVIILLGISVYFSHKNNQLQKQLLILQDRIDQQNAMIEKHEDIITKLVHTVNNLMVEQQHRPIQDGSSIKQTKQVKQTTKQVKQTTKQVKPVEKEIKPQPPSIPIETMPENPVENIKQIPPMFVQMMSSFPFQNMQQSPFFQDNIVTDNETSRVVEVTDDPDENKICSGRRNPTSPAQSEDLYAELTEELEDLRDEDENEHEK